MDLSEAIRESLQTQTAQDLQFQAFRYSTPPFLQPVLVQEDPRGRRLVKIQTLHAEETKVPFSVINSSEALAPLIADESSKTRSARRTAAAPETQKVAQAQQIDPSVKESLMRSYRPDMHQKSAPSIRTIFSGIDHHNTRTKQNTDTIDAELHGPHTLFYFPATPSQPSEAL
eukprot:TRINITY_DN11703_c0_g1_i1.p1 TRINITY_DN11703_c0_g1~~TRINITY_DN11703_c0_g1_i1.p1  ORF type:complete len:172 (+),score=35.48 TRINITY_DN11703_c0_g1_i1:61-576(+)